MIKNILALISIAVLAPAWSAETTPVSNPNAAATQEQMIEEFRTDLQAKRTDVMAKGLTLTSEQAAKFCPLYETFQKDQNASPWTGMLILSDARVPSEPVPGGYVRALVRGTIGHVTREQLRLCSGLELAAHA